MSGATELALAPAARLALEVLCVAPWPLGGPLLREAGIANPTATLSRLADAGLAARAGTAAPIPGRTGRPPVLWVPTGRGRALMAAGAAREAVPRTGVLELVPPGQGEELVDAGQAAIERASDLAAESLSAGTRRAYDTDLRAFEAWASDHGWAVLPAEAEHVAAYLAHLAGAGLSVSTIRRRAAAIAKAHRLAGHPSPPEDPRVAATLSGAARRHGTAPAGAKDALLREDLRAMLPPAQAARGLADLRDRALLLVGFAGALRRSELVALDVEDVRTSPEGIVLQLRRSKTDQEGRGRNVAIRRGEDPAWCAARALATWLERAGVGEGAVFRRLRAYGLVGERLSDAAVATIIKGRARAAGLPADGLAGHSLRAGMVTQAFRDGWSFEQIAEVTGHRSWQTLRRYQRNADPHAAIAAIT